MYNFLTFELMKTPKWWNHLNYPEWFSYLYSCLKEISTRTVVSCWHNSQLHIQNLKAIKLTQNESVVPPSHCPVYQDSIRNTYQWSRHFPFIPWPDLEWDLYRNLYGQHLVQDLVSEEVAKFLQNKNPDRPLVLSFNGPSGTGKTLVSSMLGNHLYGSAMSSPYVHQFVPTLHFPLPDRVKEYRVS